MLVIILMRGGDSEERQEHWEMTRNWKACETEEVIRGTGTRRRTWGSEGDAQCRIRFFFGGVGGGVL